MPQIKGTKDVKYVDLESMEGVSEFRIYFPGGFVSATRTSDGRFWAHIGTHDDESIKPTSRIVDARADREGEKPVTLTDVKVLQDPKLYHVAFLLERS